MNTHSELWAKQESTVGTYPLLAHMLDTACVAGVLFDEWLRPGLRAQILKALGAQARQIVQFVFGAHDVGKAIPMFQLQPRRHEPLWEHIRQTIRSSGYFVPAPEDSVVRDHNQLTVRRHEQNSAMALNGGYFHRASALELWAPLVALGHHGRFTVPSFSDWQASDDYCQELRDLGWTHAQEDLLACLAVACGVEHDDLPEEIPAALTLLLSGLVILADRIASGAEWVAEGQQLLECGELDLAAGAEWIARRAGSARARVENTVGIYQPWADAQAAQSAILGSYTPRPIQREAVQVGGGLWALMAPTGNGKTEAALLRHSTHNERLIFLLPTQATSNAIMKRVQEAYRGTPNVAALAHGLASLEDFYRLPVSSYADEGDDDDGNRTDTSAASARDGLYPSSFVKAGAARLLAPVCVGTVDQALLGALPGKWIHLRLLALANAHVVIDEVHTLDHYQTKLLEGILPWLAAMGTRVTFLTATMPSWQRDVLIRAYSGGSSKQELPAPLFPSAETVAPASGDVPVVTPIAMEPETVEFRVEYAPAEAVVERHVSWVHEARQRWPLARIGVMCNTVGRARAVARELASTGEQPLLLHSQMTARHRQLMADRLLREIGKGGAGAGLTVVGTQIIEASLDIDLDLLDTEICPAPALIQRAGRVWRRSDPRRSMRVPQLDAKQIQVLNFVDSGNNAAVLPYLLAELRNTAQFLERSRTLRFPNEVQDFVDSAAVSIADIADDADLEAMADYVQQLQHATDRRVNLKEIFSDDADTFHFSQLTDGGVPEESATRLIEEARSWRVIAGGDPTVIPGGWSGTLRDLEQIASCDTESLRAALLASAPLSGTLQSALLAAGAQQIRAKTVLGRYWYLPEAERFYDPLLGFDVAALKAASKS